MEDRVVVREGGVDRREGSEPMELNGSPSVAACMHHAVPLMQKWLKGVPWPPSLLCSGHRNSNQEMHPPQIYSNKLTVAKSCCPAVAAALLGPATLTAEPAPSPQAAGGASGDGPPTSETEPSLREVYAAIRGLAEQRDQPPRRWQPPLQHRAEPPRRNAPWVCHRCGREGHVARGCRTEPEAANVTWNLPGPNADRSQASDAVPPGLSGGPGNYTSDAANSPGVSSGWAPVVSFPGPRCSGRGKGIAPGPVVASRPGVASRTDVTLRPEVTSRSEVVSRIAPGIAPGPWTAPGIAPGPGTASGIAPRPGTAPGVAPTPGGTSRTEHPM
ncbi:uncharacterized protein LOC144931408 [Lampetra fluviatilis]